jgi:peptidoglycan/LPS O-acetylase OafA/YrhL
MSNLIKPLHGLRGIAAMTVVAGHLTLGHIMSAPALGVVLFFVLSGFLIGKLYIEQPFNLKNAWGYAVARFARVYPLFAVVIVCTALLNAVAGSNIFGLRLSAVPAHLLLAGDALTVWTISAEFQFYIFFVLIWAIRSRLPSALAASLPLLFLASAIMLWLGTDAGRINLFGYLHIFVLGLVAASVTPMVGDRFRTIAAWFIPILAVTYAAVFLFSPYFYAPRWIYMDPVAIAVCGGLLGATIIGGECLPNRILSLPPLLWLGEISFGIYLLHRPVSAVVDAIVSFDWLALPLSLALTLVFAQLAHWLIERPARRGIRQALNPLPSASIA